MARPPSDVPNGFSQIRSEKLCFVLHLARELRLAFEVAVSSRWLAWCIVAFLLKDSSTVVLKALVSRW